MEPRIRAIARAVDRQDWLVFLCQLVGADRERYEINHYFTVSIAGIASGSSPPACEPDHRFSWAGVDELEGHDLRPEPLAGLLRCYLEGERSAWWRSTAG